MELKIGVNNIKFSIIRFSWFKILELK